MQRFRLPATSSWQGRIKDVTSVNCDCWIFSRLTTSWRFIEESGAAASILHVVTELMESVLCDSVLYSGIFKEVEEPFP